jgi:hypothetical protein
MRTKENKICKILVFCTIFVANQVYAQQITLKDSTNKGFQNTYRFVNYPLHANFSTINTISANFYVKNLGFFCKQELKLEAATKIPFKFRVGSLNYCDWMEGKTNAGILPAP